MKFQNSHDGLNRGNRLDAAVADATKTADVNRAGDKDFVEAFLAKLLQRSTSD